MGTAREVGVVDIEVELLESLHHIHYLLDAVDALLHTADVIAAADGVDGELVDVDAFHQYGFHAVGFVDDGHVRPQGALHSRSRESN